MVHAIKKDNHETLNQPAARCTQVPRAVEWLVNFCLVATFAADVWAAFQLFHL